MRHANTLADPKKASHPLPPVLKTLVETTLRYKEGMTENDGRALGDGNGHAEDEEAGDATDVEAEERIAQNLSLLQTYQNGDA